MSPARRHPLLAAARITGLGTLADLVRRARHPDGIVTYIIDRNVNYTNVCNAFCRFCAFFRRPGHEEGYVLPAEEIERKIKCPLCEDIMDVHPYFGPGNVVIDSCVNCHLIWVDNGEIVTIERATGPRKR